VADRRKGTFSPQEIRERVNKVMDAWQSYPDFAQFFSALMDANGISERAFAQQYSQGTGRYTSAAHIDKIRHGHTQPTYQFVSHIADHALLSLDPERLRPGGEQRIALFTASGLVEVTPESINQWNHEVFARWERQVNALPPKSQMTWRELMGKLFSFQCQGERWSNRDIANAALSTLPKSGGMMDFQRLHNLFTETSAVPTRAERLALEHVAGLDTSQMHRIETALEDGSLTTGPRSHRSPFSARLNDILGRLRVVGISQRQLALRTAPLGQSESELSQTTLSGWKHGLSRPTLATLRRLVKGLEKCHDRANRPLVTADEIQLLVAEAGFTLDELAATTHDIVRRIDETTELKPLLVALRNATDLNVAVPAIDSEIARGEPDTHAIRMTHQLNSWEQDGSPNSPTSEQVREVLLRYNRLLQAGGKADLTEEEIQKVVEVAERDRTDGKQRGLLNRAREHHPRTARRVISPDFGGGPSR
jgi:hypothetical protein